MDLSQYLNYDKENLRKQWQVTNAKPYPYLMTDNFLKPEFARQCLGAFPTFEEAQKLGRGFDAVNEKGKIQITDSSKFQPPIAKLAEVLNSPEFLKELADITGIPNLVADAKFLG